MMKKDAFSVDFSYLNKSEFDGVAHKLFEILADNMEKIAPTGNSREEDYKLWYNAVKEGIKKDIRQIVLIKVNDVIVGFFQYYVNTDTFMMEEIQIIPAFQGTEIFRRLYGFLIYTLREDIKYVEAYANKENYKSIGILEHLGLSKIGTNKNGNSFRFKGFYRDLIKWYEEKY